MERDSNCCSNLKLLRLKYGTVQVYKNGFKKTLYKLCFEDAGDNPNPTVSCL